MAISDIKGTVSTTGIMNNRPVMPQGKVDPKLPTQEIPKQETKTLVEKKTEQPIAKEASGSSLKEQFPNATETEIVLAERFKTLTAEDRASISAVLSPSVTSALSKMLPEFKPLMEQIGSEEPNLVMPMSVAANYAMKQYNIQDPKQAVTVFAEDIFGNTQMETQQTNVPPSNQSESLMTSPQNMETV